jgi:predicted dehydrogenase
MAHLPALAELPEFELVAVATTKESSARATAEAWGVPLYFASGPELAAHPDVDLVAVSVKVPDHAAVVRAALANGKHVFSEWPLGVDAAEAAELSGLATEAGVTTLVGLQGTHGAAARYVKDLIAEGKIGQVLSVAVIAASGLGGTRVPSFLSWATDKAAGVTALTITGGHVLGTVTEVVGGIAEVHASIGNLVEEATVVDTGEKLTVTAPGQLVVSGRLASGAVLSVTIQGAAPAGTGGFFLKIVGTEGAVTVIPSEPGGSIHISDWIVEVAGAEGPATVVEVPDSYRVAPAAVPSGPPTNVAALYREIAQAINEGREAYPSFTTAVAFQQLLETIEEAHETGVRQQIG